MKRTIVAGLLGMLIVAPTLVSAGISLGDNTAGSAPPATEGAVARFKCER